MGDLIALARITVADISLDVLVQIGPVIVASDTFGGAFPIVVNG